MVTNWERYRSLAPAWVHQEPATYNYDAAPTDPAHGGKLTAEQATELIEALRLEVYVLRMYGNKSCTAMADEALEQKRQTGKGPWED